MLSAIEQFALPGSDERFELAFAMRVGALDGRHPDAGKLSITKIRAALKPTGRLFIDGGNPLREIALHDV